MDEVSIAWITASVVLAVVLLVAWKMTRSFFKAWLVMLLVGKVLAAIYYFAGLDRTVFIINLVNRQNPEITRIVHVTAAELLFISFLLTLVSSIVIVLYTDLLPRELRTLKRMYEVSENE